MKKKQNLSEDTYSSDKLGRTDTDLKRLGKCDPHFKSISENIFTFQDRKFSENTSNALVSSFSHALHSDLAIGDSNSISTINSNTRPAIPVEMGAGTGNICRNLQPRQHTVKLSE